MIPYWMSRTQLLLGDEKVESLMNKHVLIAGLGGVGGICAEMIVRSGVGRITIVDADVVDLSNCNRQVVALQSNAGNLKAEEMAARLQAINPDLNITIVTTFLNAETTAGILDEHPLDYAVDCIDTLGSKVFFIKSCMDRNIPIVSSMGAGGKIDPLQIKIEDISRSFNCTLAKYVRKRLHEVGIRTGFKVVFSPEPIDESRVIVTEKAHPKKTLIGTISYMPAIFGCMVASVVIRGLMGSEEVAGSGE